MLRLERIEVINAELQDIFEQISYKYIYNGTNFHFADMDIKRGALLNNGHHLSTVGSLVSGSGLTVGSTSKDV